MVKNIAQTPSPRIRYLAILAPCGGGSWKSIGASGPDPLGKQAGG